MIKKKQHNFINGNFIIPSSNDYLTNFNPHTGQKISSFVNSNKNDVNMAVIAAKSAFEKWSSFSPQVRGDFLFKIAFEMDKNKKALAKCVSIETGKSINDAVGEVEASIKQANYFAGEGARFFSTTLTSSNQHKQTFSLRHPLGVAACIVPANTPIANISWKIFPALISGNTVILKSSEDAPELANLVAAIVKDCKLPKGVLNVIHGDGNTGSILVNNPSISVVSFTGSTKVGKEIHKACSDRLTRVSLELGGKNPFIICDDADLENASNWALLSAFSNAGQRCASASRILVHENVYDNFKNLFIKKTSKLKLGIASDSDIGPLIREDHLNNVISIINSAIDDGGKLHAGGKRAMNKGLTKGYYMQPTIISGLPNLHTINQTELFAPICSLIPFKDNKDAINLAHESDFGLTSAVHTSSVSRSVEYFKELRFGVININAGTYGSEYNMPFGGFNLSGNGTREPGQNALDVYTELKNISLTQNA